MLDASNEAIPLVNSASGGFFNRRRTVAAAILLILALFPMVAWLTDNPFLLRLATRIMIFGVAALALDLALGFGGMVMLCNAAFVGIGAYVVAIFSWHAANNEPLIPGVLDGSNNALLVWPIAMLVTAFVAFVLGLFALRTRGVYFIMITLAFNEMLHYIFVGWRKYGGLDGINLAARSELPLIDLRNHYALYYLVFALLAGCLYACWRLIHSRFGVVLRGSEQNERRMLAIGYRPFQYKLAAFTICGALSGLAGALLANATEYVSPTEMSWTRSAEFVAMLIFGGVGTLVGPIIGSTVYLGLHHFLINYIEHWEGTFGAILILIVMFGRGGIYDLLLRDGERRK